MDKINKVLRLIQAIIINILIKSVIKLMIDKNLRKIYRLEIISRKLFSSEMNNVKSELI